MSETIYASKKSAGSYILWKNKSPILGNLDIELTERCNNDCIHCCICQPENDSPAKDQELSAQDIKDILAEAAGLGLLIGDEKGWEIKEWKERIAKLR